MASFAKKPEISDDAFEFMTETLRGGIEFPSDGGYRDTFNAYKEKAEYFDTEYRAQMKGLIERKKRAKDDRTFAIRTLIVEIAVPVFLIVILKLLKYLLFAGTVVAMGYVIFGALVGLIIAVDLIYIPASFKQMMNSYSRYKILMNKGDMESYIKKNSIITFIKEERFLNQKIHGYQQLLKDIDRGELDEMTAMNEMRKFSEYEEYRASSVEGMKYVDPWWLMFTVVAVLVSIVAIISLLAGCGH